MSVIDIEKVLKMRQSEADLDLCFWPVREQGRL